MARYARLRMAVTPNPATMVPVAPQIQGKIVCFLSLTMAPHMTSALKTVKKMMMRDGVPLRWTAMALPKCGTAADITATCQVTKKLAEFIDNISQIFENFQESMRTFRATCLKD